MNLPAAFKKEIEEQLGLNYEKFERSLQQIPPVSIRYNRAKNGSENKAFTKAVPWQSDAYYLSERPTFTLDPLFHAGAFYVQEASSMLVGYALAQCTNLSKPMRVLDLCAAPGGKTTLLASILHPDSLLLANEVIKSRVAILKENIQKWGLPNVHISNHDPEELRRLEGFFDIILIDAPCSGEGLFRKNPAAIKEWSEANVQLCSARQERILQAALPLLSAGGTLIYCTCTYNKLENQVSIEAVKSQLEEQKLDFPIEWGITSKPIGYQCYPHLVKGEGFFLAVFKKKAGSLAATIQPPRGWASFKPLPKNQVSEVTKWIEYPSDFEFFVKPNGDVIGLLKSQLSDLMILDKTLFAKGLGVELGTFKGKDFIPAHALALSIAIRAAIPKIELTENEALQFLKKENLNLNAPKGWVLATYEGLGLGWIKGLGNRLNNYLPKEWRIRMEISD